MKSKVLQSIIWKQLYIRSCSSVTYPEPIHLGAMHTYSHVLPGQFFIDTGELLQVGWIPVVCGLVLLCQVLHNGNAAKVIDQFVTETLGLATVLQLLLKIRMGICLVTLGITKDLLSSLITLPHQISRDDWSLNWTQCFHSHISAEQRWSVRNLLHTALLQCSESQYQHCPVLLPMVRPTSLKTQLGCKSRECLLLLYRLPACSGE